MSYIRRPYSSPDQEYGNPPQTKPNTQLYFFKPPRLRSAFALGIIGVFFLCVGLAGIGQCADEFRLGIASHTTNNQLVMALFLAIVCPVLSALFFFLAKRIASNAWAYKKAEARFYYGKR